MADKKKKKFNSGSAFKNYAKNAGKSLGSIGKEVYFNDDEYGISSVKDFFETNSELFAAGIEAGKNYKQISKEIGKKIDDAVFKNIKDLKKNFLSDLKSGNFNNKQRLDKTLGEGMDDFDFGDFDEKMDSFDEKMDDFGDSVDELSSGIDNMSNSISQSVVSTSVSSIKANMSMHKQSMQGMSAIGGVVNQLVSFNNSVMSPYIDKALDYYNQSLDLKRESNELLKQMLDTQRDVLDQQTEINQSVIETIGGLSTENFNLAEYGKHIKNNVSDILFEAGFGGSGDMSVGGAMKAIIANPVGETLTAIMKKATPEFHKIAVKSFNDAFSSFVPALLRKVSGWVDDESDDSFFGMFKRMAGRIFGIESLNGKSSINLGGYEKGKVAFDGITRKTIVDVIPTYLRKILAAMPGQKGEIIFDKQSGEFTTFDKVKEKYQSMDNIGFMDFSNTRDQISKNLQQQLGLGFEEINKLTSSFDEVLQSLRDNSTGLVKRNITKEQAGYKGSDEMWESFSKVLQNFTKEQMLVLQKELSESQSRRKDMYSNISKDLDSDVISSILMTRNIDDIRSSSRSSNSSTAVSSDLLKSINKRINKFSNINKLDDTEFNKQQRKYEKRRQLEEEARRKGKKFDEAKFEREYVDTGDIDVLSGNKTVQGAKAKYKTITEAVQSAVAKPFKLLEKAFQKADNWMYKVIFGDSNDPNSFGNKLRDNINKAKDYLFGKDSLFSKAKDGLGNLFISAKETLFGKKDEEGNIINGGGLLTDSVNSLKSVGLQAMNFLFGKEYVDPRTGKLIAKKEKPLFGVIRDKFNQVTTKMSNFFFGEKDEEGNLVGKEGLFGNIRNKFFDLAERTKIYLFGGESDDGKKAWKGVISKEFQEKFKKYAPKTTIGSGAGLLGSLFLPGGPITGLLVGGAIGFVSEIDGVKDFLWGEEDSEGKRSNGIFTKIKKQFLDYSDKAKNYLFGKDENKAGGYFNMSFKSAKKGTGIGAGAGLIGSLFLPGGPFLGTLIGAATGFASQTEKFQNFLFGDKDASAKDTKLKRLGLLGAAKETLFDKVINPIRDYAVGTFTFVKEWVNKKMIQPFNLAFKPIAVEAGLQLKKTFLGITTFIKNLWTDFMDGMKDKMNQLFGGAMSKYVFAPVGNFLKNTWERIGSGIGGWISGKVEKIQNYAGRLREKHMAEGNGSYMSEDTAYGKLLKERNLYNSANGALAWERKQSTMSGTLQDHINAARDRRIARAKELGDNPFSKSFDINKRLKKYSRKDLQQLAAENPEEYEKIKDELQQGLEASYNTSEEDLLNEAQKRTTEDVTKSKDKYDTYVKNIRKSSREAMRDISKDPSATRSDRLLATLTDSTNIISSGVNRIAGVLTDIRGALYKKFGLKTDEEISKLNNEDKDRLDKDQIRNAGIYEEDYLKKNTNKVQDEAVKTRQQLERTADKMGTTIENSGGEEVTITNEDGTTTIKKSPIKTALSGGYTDNGKAGGYSKAEMDQDKIEERVREVQEEQLEEQRKTNSFLGGFSDTMGKWFGKGGKLLAFGAKILKFLPKLLLGLAAFKTLKDLFGNIKDKLNSLNSTLGPNAGLGDKVRNLGTAAKGAIQEQFGSMGDFALDAGKLLVNPIVGPLNKAFNRGVGTVLTKGIPTAAKWTVKQAKKSPYIKTAKKLSLKNLNPLNHTSLAKAYGNDVVDNFAFTATREALEDTTGDILARDLMMQRAGNAGADITSKYAQKQTTKLANKLNIKKMALSQADDVAAKYSANWYSKMLTNVASSPTVNKYLGGTKFGRKAIDQISQKAASASVKAIKNQGENVALKQTTKFLNAFGGNALMFGVDAARGYNEANRIFKLPSGVSPTFSMKASAAVGKGISELLLGLVDPGWISNVIYNTISDEDERNNLKIQQFEMQKEAADAMGFNLEDLYSSDREIQKAAEKLLDQYNTQQNKTAVQKLNNWYKTGGGKEIGKTLLGAAKFMFPGFAGAASFVTNALDKNRQANALNLASLDLVSRSASGFAGMLDTVSFGLFKYNDTVKGIHGALLYVKDGLVAVKEGITKAFKWFGDLPNELKKMVDNWAGYIEGALSGTKMEALTKPIITAIQKFADMVTFMYDSVKYVIDGATKALGLQGLWKKFENRSERESQKNNMDAINKRLSSLDPKKQATLKEMQKMETSKAAMSNPDYANLDDTQRSNVNAIASQLGTNDNVAAFTGAYSLDSEYGIAQGTKAYLQAAKNKISDTGNNILLATGGATTVSNATTDTLNKVNAENIERVLKEATTEEGGFSVDRVQDADLGIAQQILETRYQLQNALNDNDTEEAKSIANSNIGKLLQQSDNTFKDLLAQAEIKPEDKDPVSLGRKIAMGTVGTILSFPLATKVFAPILDAVRSSIGLLLTPFKAVLKVFGLYKPKGETKHTGKFAKIGQAADYVHKKFKEAADYFVQKLDQAGNAILNATSVTGGKNVGAANIADNADIHLKKSKYDGAGVKSSRSDVSKQAYFDDLAASKLVGAEKAYLQAVQSGDAKKAASIKKSAEKYGGLSSDVINKSYLQAVQAGDSESIKTIEGFGMISSGTMAKVKVSNSLTQQAKARQAHELAMGDHTSEKTALRVQKKLNKNRDKNAKLSQEIASLYGTGNKDRIAQLRDEIAKNKEAREYYQNTANPALYAKNKYLMEQKQNKINKVQARMADASKSGDTELFSKLESQYKKYIKELNEITKETEKSMTGLTKVTHNAGKAMNKVGDTVKEGADFIGNKAKSGAKIVTDTTKKVGKSVKEGADFIGNKAKSGAKIVTDTTKKVGKSVKEGFETHIASPVKKATTTVSDKVKKLGTTVSNKFNELSEKVTGTSPRIKKATDKAAKNLDKAAKVLSTETKEFGDDVAKSADTAANKIDSAGKGKGILGSLKSGLKNSSTRKKLKTGLVAGGVALAAGGILSSVMNGQKSTQDVVRADLSDDEIAAAQNLLSSINNGDMSVSDLTEEEAALVEMFENTQTKGEKAKSTIQNAIGQGMFGSTLQAAQSLSGLVGVKGVDGKTQIKLSNLLSSDGMADMSTILSAGGAGIAGIGSLLVGDDDEEGLLSKIKGHFKGKAADKAEDVVKEKGAGMLSKLFKKGGKKVAGEATESIAENGIKKAASKGLLGKLFSKGATTALGTAGTGLLGSAGTTAAATGASGAATAAGTAGLGAIGSVALPIAAAAYLGVQGFKGVARAGENFGLAEGEQSTAGQKAASAIGNIFTPFMSDETKSKVSKTFYEIGSGIGGMFGAKHTKVVNGKNVTIDPKMEKANQEKTSRAYNDTAKRLTDTIVEKSKATTSILDEIMRSDEGIDKDKLKSVAIDNITQGVCTLWDGANQLAMTQFKQAMGLDTKTNLAKFGVGAIKMAGKVGAGFLLGGPIGAAIVAGKGIYNKLKEMANPEINEKIQNTVNTFSGKIQDMWITKFESTYAWIDEFSADTSYMDTEVKPDVLNVTKEGIKTGVGTLWGAANQTAYEQFKKAMGIDTKTNVAKAALGVLSTTGVGAGIGLAIGGPVGAAIGAGVGAAVYGFKKLFETAYPKISEKIQTSVNTFSGKIQDMWITKFDQTLPWIDELKSMDVSEIKSSDGTDVKTAVMDATKNTIKDTIGLLWAASLETAIGQYKTAFGLNKGANIAKATVNVLAAAGTGAAAGAVIGGPIGAVIGGLVGAGKGIYDILVPKVSETVQKASNNLINGMQKVWDHFFDQTIGDTEKTNGWLSELESMSVDDLTGDNGESLKTSVINSSKVAIRDALASSWSTTLGNIIKVYSDNLNKQSTDNNNPFVTSTIEDNMNVIEGVATHITGKFLNLVQDKLAYTIGGDITVKELVQNGYDANGYPIYNQVDRQIGSYGDGWLKELEDTSIGDLEASGGSFKDSVLNSAKTSIQTAISDIWSQTISNITTVFKEKINKQSTDNNNPFVTSEVENLEEDIQRVAGHITEKMTDLLMTKLGYTVGGTISDLEYASKTEFGDGWIGALQNDSIISDDVKQNVINNTKSNIGDTIQSVWSISQSGVADKFKEVSGEQSKDKWFKTTAIENLESDITEVAKGLVEKIVGLYTNRTSSVTSSVTTDLYKDKMEDAKKDLKRDTKDDLRDVISNTNEIIRSTIKSKWYSITASNKVTKALSSNEKMDIGQKIQNSMVKQQSNLADAWTSQFDKIGSYASTLSADSSITDSIKLDFTYSNNDAMTEALNYAWEKSLKQVRNRWNNIVNNVNGTSGGTGFFGTLFNNGEEATEVTSNEAFSESDSAIQTSLETIIQSLSKLWANTLNNIAQTINAGSASSAVFTSSDVESSYNDLSNGISDVGSYFSSVKAIDDSVSVKSYFSGGDFGGKFGGFKKFIFFTKRIMGLAPAMTKELSKDIENSYNGISDSLSSVGNTLESSISSAKSAINSVSSPSGFFGSVSSSGPYAGLQKAAYYMGKLMLFPIWMVKDLSKKIESSFTGVTSDLTRLYDSIKEKIENLKNSTNGSGGWGKGGAHGSSVAGSIANKPYAGSTMKDAGCGPLAATAALQAVTGQNIDAYKDVAQFNEANGYTSSELGTNSNFLYGIGNKYNVRTSEISPDDQKSVDMALMNGKAIIANGINSSNANSPYTTRGHYINITGKDENGRYIVSDPTNGKSGAYTWNQIAHQKGSDPTARGWEGARQFYALQSNYVDDKGNVIPSLANQYYGGSQEYTKNELAIANTMKSLTGKMDYTQGDQRTNIPGGWSDCSSLTWWLYKNLFGMDIGTSTWTSIDKGKTVASNGKSANGLRPGDLVFYAKPGTQHVEMITGPDGEMMGHGSGIGPKLHNVKTYNWINGGSGYKVVKRHDINNATLNPLNMKAKDYKGNSYIISSGDVSNGSDSVETSSSDSKSDSNTTTTKYRKYSKLISDLGNVSSEYAKSVLKTQYGIEDVGNFASNIGDTLLNIIDPEIEETKTESTDTTTTTTMTNGTNVNVDGTEASKLTASTFKNTDLYQLAKVSQNQIKNILDTRFAIKGNSIFTKSNSAASSDGIFRAQNETNISSLIPLGIGAWESGWGTSKIARDKGNLWGWAAYNSSPYASATNFGNNTYDSFKDYTNKLLNTYYKGYGAHTIHAIGTGENPAGKGYAYFDNGSINKKWADSIASVAMMMVQSMGGKGGFGGFGSGKKTKTNLSFNGFGDYQSVQMSDYRTNTANDINKTLAAAKVISQNTSSDSYMNIEAVIQYLKAIEENTRATANNTAADVKKLDEVIDAVKHGADGSSTNQTNNVQVNAPTTSVQTADVPNFFTGGSEMPRSVIRDAANTLAKGI